MIDLETRLRETMDRHAPSAGSREMPANTSSRVGRRRAAAIVTTISVAVAFLVGAAGLARYLSDGPARQRPAAEGTAAIPTPAPGVTYVTPAPFADLAPGDWPRVEVGGVDDPYVDREVGDDEVSTAKVVVASGSVEGVEWTMTAFGADRTNVGNIGWGTCGELFLGDMGTNGGVRVCTNVAGDPGQRDLRIAGSSFGTGPVSAYAGIVSDRVERVVFDLADGSSTEADLVEGPRTLGARFFVLFVPNDAAGTVSALDDGGATIATEPLCIDGPATADEVTMCGNGAAWAASAVSIEPH